MGGDLKAVDGFLSPRQGTRGQGGVPIVVPEGSQRPRFLRSNGPETIWDRFRESFIALPLWLLLLVVDSVLRVFVANAGAVHLQND